MGRLPHVSLGTVGIDHDPVKKRSNKGPNLQSVLHRDSRNTRQMHGLFYELVSNASSMAWSRFYMGKLPRANLGTVRIDHDTIKKRSNKGT